MRRAAAAFIIGVFVAAGACVIGAEARGDRRGEELVRDTMTGLGILGFAAAVRWALEELGEQAEP